MQLPWHVLHPLITDTLVAEEQEASQPSHFHFGVVWLGATPHEPETAQASLLRLPICLSGPGKSKMAQTFKLLGAGKSKMVQTSKLLFPGPGKSKMVQTSNFLFPDPGKSNMHQTSNFESNLPHRFPIAFSSLETISTGEVRAHNLLLISFVPYPLGYISLENKPFSGSRQTGYPARSSNLLFPAQTSNLLFPGPEKEKWFRIPICLFPGREKAKGSDFQFAFSRPGKSKMVQTSNLPFPGQEKAKWPRLPICFFPGWEKAKGSDFQFAFSRAGKKQNGSDFQFAFSGPGKSKVVKTSNLLSPNPGKSKMVQTFQGGGISCRLSFFSRAGKKQNGSDFQFAFSWAGKKLNGSSNLLFPGPGKSKMV